MGARVCMILVVAAVLLGAGVPPQSRFAEVVLGAFGDKGARGWDRDLNGVLSAREVLAAVMDPGVTDERAAACAALHGWLEAVGTAKAPRLTREWFQGAGERELDARFAAALRRIRETPRVLYVDGGARYDQVRQGAVGDCFLLSPLAGIAHRDPEAIRKMITPIEKKRTTAEMNAGPPAPVDPRTLRYRVKFADGRAVEVGAPTDGELALPGAGTRAGLWVRIVEKAYAQRRRGVGEQVRRSPAEGLDGGGEAVLAGAALTGHAFEFVYMVGNFKAKMSEGDLEARALAIRARLTEALGAGRVVLACNDGGMPPSILEHHSYVVIGLDAKTDVVEMYNTAGMNFTPDGPEGFAHGYSQQGGTVRVPLREFVRAFTDLVVETGRRRAG